MASLKKLIDLDLLDRFFTGVKALFAPKDRGVEYIRGTWTAASGTWTGVSKDTELYDGKQIILYMPFAGSGNATLNLTLADGSTTGAKDVYFESTTRFTTHKGQNSQLHLIYHSALTLSNGTTYEGWWYMANRDTTVNYQMRHANNVLALEAIPQYHLACGTASGYKKVVSGVTFDVSYPLLITQAAWKINTKYSNGMFEYQDQNIRNTIAALGSSYAGLTVNSMVYLVGTLSGTTFTVDSSLVTCTPPNTANGKAYIPLGIAYSTYQFYFCSQRLVYEYSGGSFHEVSVYARDSATVSGHTVAANVPSDAKFTDTTYESKAAASGGTAVSLVTTGEKYTWNNKGNGTITGITMNGASKGTSGVVDLGTVITAHQSLSGKQDKLVSGTNIKSINGVSLLGSGDLAVSGLPTVTSSDNDKVLKVVNGVWAAAEGDGGSSLTYTDAILHVNTLLGSSVTFTKGSISERLTSDAAHPNADGITADYYYIVQAANFGSWTITAALNGVYSSGTLSPSEAKQYDLSLRYKTQLYYKGNTFDSITGGWLLRPYNSNATFSFDPNYININMNSSSGIIVTSSKIDVTDYKSLYFVFYTVTSISSSPRAYIALNAYEHQILDANNSSYLAHLEPRIQMSTTTGDNIVVKLDISSSEGEHYVEFAMSTNIVCKLEEVYLSPWS